MGLQIQTDKPMMANQPGHRSGRQVEEDGRSDCYTELQQHKEKGTREAQEVPRPQRRTEEDMEGEGNSDPCGNQNTWCSDPK